VRRVRLPSALHKLSLGFLPLCCALCFCEQQALARLGSVSVTIEGPTAGSANQDLAYVAHGSWSEDTGGGGGGGAAASVPSPPGPPPPDDPPDDPPPDDPPDDPPPDGPISHVLEGYWWTVAPASVVAGSTMSQSVTLRYSPEQSGRTYILRVAYTVIAYYAGGLEERKTATDEHEVTIDGDPGAAQSSAFLAIYRYEGLSSFAPDPIGGDVYVALIIDMAPSDRLATESGTVRLTDLYEGYREEVVTDWDIALPMSAWQRWTGTEWVTDSPGVYNPTRTTTCRFRTFVDWQTQGIPTGCNGSHRVELLDTLTFETCGEGGTVLATATVAVSPIRVEVLNACIYNSEVTASSGNIDYFKWNPDGEGALADPSITVTIHDADPHSYKLVVWFRQTNQGGLWDYPYWAVSTLVWNSELDQQVTADIPLSAARSPGGLDPGVHAAGTYAYDVGVFEFEGENPPGEGGFLVDEFYLKCPYALWVGDHDLDIRGNTLEVRYRLHHQSGLDAETLEVTAMDASLDERHVNTTLPRTQGVTHGDPDPLPVWEIPGDDASPAWRAVWSADDAEGLLSPYRRTHEITRMIVANAGPKDNLWGTYLHQYWDGTTIDAFIAHAAAGCTDPGALPPDFDPDDSTDLDCGYYDAGAWIIGWYPLGAGPLQKFDGPASMQLDYVPAGTQDPLRVGDTRQPAPNRADGTPRPDGTPFAAFEFSSAMPAARREACIDILRRIAALVRPEAVAELSLRLQSQTSGAIEGSAKLTRDYELFGFNCARFATYALGLDDGALDEYGGDLNPPTLANSILAFHAARTEESPVYLMGLLTYNWELLQCGCSSCRTRNQQLSTMPGITRPDGSAVSPYPEFNWAPG